MISSELETILLLSDKPSDKIPTAVAPNKISFPPNLVIFFPIFLIS